jgi:hypothetical protein
VRVVRGPDPNARSHDARGVQRRIAGELPVGEVCRRSRLCPSNQRSTEPTRAKGGMNRTGWTRACRDSKMVDQGAVVRCADDAIVPQRQGRDGPVVSTKCADLRGHISASSHGLRATTASLSHTCALPRRQFRSHAYRPTNDCFHAAGRLHGSESGTGGTSWELGSVGFRGNEK